VGILADHAQTGSRRQISFQDRPGIDIGTSLATRERSSYTGCEPLEALSHHLVIIPTTSVTSDIGPEISRGRILVNEGVILQRDTKGAARPRHDLPGIQSSLPTTLEIGHTGVVTTPQPLFEVATVTGRREIGDTCPVETLGQGPVLQQLCYLGRLHRHRF